MAVKVNIEKNFRDFSLKVDFEGSSASIGLLGASGSGKSMTLRCIAGIETPDKGRIGCRAYFLCLKGDHCIFDIRNDLFMFCMHDTHS